MVRRGNPGEAPHKGNDRFEGYCIDLLKLLAKNISGFEYEIFVSDGNKDGMIFLLKSYHENFNRQSMKNSWGSLQPSFTDSRHCRCSLDNHTRKRKSCGLFETVYDHRSIRSTSVFDWPSCRWDWPAQTSHLSAGAIGEPSLALRFRPLYLREGHVTLESTFKTSNEVALKISGPTAARTAMVQIKSDQIVRPSNRASETVSLTIFLVSSFSPYEQRVQFNHGEFSVSNEFSMYNSLWFTLAAFMQQGTDILPKALSGRIASSAWWFFTLIIVSSYTANLAAFLTLEKMTPPIESVEDLANQNKILYGVVKGGSTAAFFEDSTVPLYKKMWDFMQDEHNKFLRNQVSQSVFVDTYAEGIERVRSSKIYVGNPTGLNLLVPNLSKTDTWYTLRFIFGYNEFLYIPMLSCLPEFLPLGNHGSLIGSKMVAGQNDI
ncbi:Ligand-gated ion channel [Teladorsagia circumcincta]|uniref:Ligand-gated ion channel n=1 Tax=Teladorsagia circumcincta TaxID=45464 RepID=A0A2G9V1K2_TELCI|nr:Ligand-gated ion channel [Teladorsagia circumcincta]